MNFFKTIISIIVFLCILFIFIFFKGYLFLFFENLRMAIWGTFNKEVSYRSLLEYKMNNIYTSPFNTTQEKTAFSENGFNYMKLKVFSSYPFNNYSKLILEGGKDIGLKENMPVLAFRGTLLGIISKVKSKTSEVDTIFSPAWKSSVFIGEKNIKGLLKGGASPTVDFVLKENKVDLNSTVYNADSRLPLNLEIGKVLDEKENNNWKSFSIEVPYDLNFLSEVLVITNFE